MDPGLPTGVKGEGYKRLRPALRSGFLGKPGVKTMVLSISIPKTDGDCGTHLNRKPLKSVCWHRWDHEVSL